MKSKRERESAERPARTEETRGEKERGKREVSRISAFSFSASGGGEIDDVGVVRRASSFSSSSSSSILDNFLARRRRDRFADSHYRAAPRKIRQALPVTSNNRQFVASDHETRATRAAVIPENRDGGREKWRKVSLYKIGRRTRASDMDDGGRQSRDRSQDIQSLC